MQSAEGSTVNSRRKCLLATVCAICQEAGFETAEKGTIETLAEMIESFVVELGRSSRAFCELTGRTEIIFGDVIMALIEMGINVESIPGYAKRPIRTSLSTPSSTSKPYNPKILQAGEKRPLPPYIPEHHPTFPDPHAYIRTPTHKQPVTEYEAIREKAASQKRDVERALTRFVAKTGTIHSLFADDTTLFPLIACRPTANPFLLALLPKDQMFDEEVDEKAQKKKSKTDCADDANSSKLDTSLEIDNPYLRPVKLPRKRRR